MNRVHRAGHDWKNLKKRLWDTSKISAEQGRYIGTFTELMEIRFAIRASAR